MLLRTSARVGGHVGQLDGRVAIITGAGRGLGREHALHFASEGAAVVVNDTGVDSLGRDPTPGPADAVAEEIASAGGRAVGSAVDAARPECAEELVHTALSSFGRLDILVNNVGLRRDAPIADLDD